MMRTRAIVAGLACAALALPACNPEHTPSESTGQPGATKSYTFGLANQQESVTFPAALAKGAKAKAAQLGVKIVDLDSQGDQTKQASQVQDLIAQKVNAIILVPLSPGPAQALADQTAAAGIPIGTAHGYVGANQDVSTPYAKLKFVIDENELGAGATAGAMAVKAIPAGGKVAGIRGSAGVVESTTPGTPS